MYNNDDKKSPESSDFDYYPNTGRSTKKIWIIAIAFFLVAVAVLYFAIFNPGIFKHKSKIVTSVVVTTDSTKVGPPDSLAYHPAQTDYSNLNISTENNKFHIIAGVFVIEKNANAYMEQLKGKGYDPKIVLKKGDYNFISIFSFPTFNEANAKCKSIGDIPIWIMKY